jgi:hypothetical protein
VNRLSGPLAELDQVVQRALVTGDQAGLEVLGYGEISLVVVLDTPEGRYACKRLPLFENQASFDRYAEVFENYVTALRAAGIDVLASELTQVPDEQPVVAYCVQPILDPALLGVSVARGPDAKMFVETVVDVTANTIGSTLGLDAQISNWALVDGDVVYLDVTTPLLRDDLGAEQLDLDLYVASLPWLMRTPVRRFLLDDILRTYYSQRGALLDLVGNLVKERLDDVVPHAVAAANVHVDPDITIDEVRSYYKRDALMWGLLQRLRLIDRGWQRYVRRRAYPFLLPPRIER